MSETDRIIRETYIKLNEYTIEDAYYGFSVPLEKIKNNYSVACRDCECLETIDMDQIKRGDVVFVSEDDEREIYQVKVT
jgi:hypothetical protein